MGNEIFDTSKFASLSVFTVIITTICLKILAKPLPKDAKSPLPVDVHCSKMPLVKLPKATLAYFSCCYHFFGYLLACVLGAWK